MPQISDYDNPTEDQECEAFSQWLRLHGIEHTHIANESGRGRAAMLRTAKLKRLGQSKGFPDYLIVILTKLRKHTVPIREHEDGQIEYFGYRLVAIEMKRKKGGRISPEQKQWLETLNSAGIEAVVCKGAAEAIKFIEESL